MKTPTPPGGRRQGPRTPPPHPLGSEGSQALGLRRSSSPQGLNLHLPGFWAPARAHTPSRRSTARRQTPRGPMSTFIHTPGPPEERTLPTARGAYKRLSVCSASKITCLHQRLEPFVRKMSCDSLASRGWEVGVTEQDAGSQQAQPGYPPAPDRGPGHAGCRRGR